MGAGETMWNVKASVIIMVIDAYGETAQNVKMRGASGGTEKKEIQHHATDDTVDIC